MSGQAEVIYASPSLRILEMTAPVGIRLIGLSISAIGTSWSGR